MSSDKKVPNGGIYVFRGYWTRDAIVRLGPAAIRRLIAWCGPDWQEHFAPDDVSRTHLEIMLATSLPISVTKYRANDVNKDYTKLVGEIGPLLLTVVSTMCRCCGTSAEMPFVDGFVEADDGVDRQGLFAAAFINDELAKHRRCFDYHAYLSSDAWRSVRNAALARDGARCVLCGSCRRLEVHHINYASIGHETSDDLLTLCDKCHADVEGRTAAEKAEAA